MTALRHRIEAGLFAVAAVLARILPRRGVRAAGRMVGDLGRVVDRRHRAITEDNLQQAFPDLDREDIGRIGRDCWRHFGETLLDTLTFPGLGPDSLGRDVHFRGLQHLEQAYGAGQGLLQFSGHLGHWELAALMQGHIGYPMSIVARPLDNPRLEKRLAGVRSGSGNLLIHKRSAVRAMMEALRARQSVGLLIDQDARRNGVFVPFFHRPASTTPTLALLAFRTGVPIVPFRSIRERDGSWTIEYLPALRADPGADRQREVHRITSRCTAMLEGWIREHPEQWLWMHRRWKTRPDPAVE